MSDDGRRIRGAASRAQLIEAALGILEREGAQGVTQRAVAREAGMAANAVTYHFGSVDNLLTSAIEAGSVAWSKALAGIPPESFARDVAANLLAELANDRSRMVAEIELYLFAARRPALRPAARRWTDAVTSAFGDLTEVERRSLVAAVDGVCIQLLLADEPPSAEAIQQVIERALPGPRAG
ncbi:TetR family transcriptional regulator [Patulibacter sp. NPDC049589]|uniref:TetR/AcrR family transcriptional regulator n=1 Tax=Patulibacter sp. NPDC049589 TaxID=3154731 RepID=UPI00342B878A